LIPWPNPGPSHRRLAAGPGTLFVSVTTHGAAPAGPSPSSACIRIDRYRAGELSAAFLSSSSSPLAACEARVPAPCSAHPKCHWCPRCGRHPQQGGRRRRGGRRGAERRQRPQRPCPRRPRRRRPPPRRQRPLQAALAAGGRPVADRARRRRVAGHHALGIQLRRRHAVRRGAPRVAWGLTHACDGRTRSCGLTGGRAWLALSRAAHADFLDRCVQGCGLLQQFVHFCQQGMHEHIDAPVFGRCWWP